MHNAQEAGLTEGCASVARERGTSLAVQDKRKHYSRRRHLRSI